MEIKREFFPELQSLRGICAIMIVIHHINDWKIFSYISAIKDFNFFVDFFFVLSGFVISLNFKHSVRDFRSYKEFIFKRWFRIYPLFIIISIPFIVMSILKTYLHNKYNGNDFDITDFLYYISLTYKWGFVKTLIFNPTAWSISVELFLYLFIGIIFLLQLSKSRYRNLLIIIISISILVLMISTGSLYELDRFVLLRGLFSFFLGALTNFYYQKRKRDISEVVVNKNNIYIFGVVTIMLVFCFYLLHFKAYFSFLFPIIWAAIIYLVVNYKLPRAFYTILNLRVFLFLGSISYSIYLIHPLLLLIIFRYFDKFKLQSSFFYSFNMALLYTICVIGCSWLTYKFIELKGLALYRKK